MKRVTRQLTSPAARITATIALSVAAAFAIASSPEAANPDRAAAAEALSAPVILAQAASTPAPAAMKTSVKHSPTDRAEARIKDLHSRLKITADQEDQWKQVAEVMRDNAQTMEELIKARSENAKTMTAIDDLKSYGAITEAHADGLRKFTPVFEALYDKMSDAQKKSADALFRSHGHKPSMSAAPARKD